MNAGHQARPPGSGPRISTVKHWVFGLDELVRVRHGDVEIAIRATRKEVRRGEAVHISIQEHERVTISRDSLGWYCCACDDSQLKFRARYQDDDDRRGDRNKFELVFLAPADWAIQWQRYTEARPRDPAPRGTQGAP